MKGLEERAVDALEKLAAGVSDVRRLAVAVDQHTRIALCNLRFTGLQQLLEQVVAEGNDDITPEMAGQFAEKFSELLNEVAKLKKEIL